MKHMRVMIELVREKHVAETFPVYLRKLRPLLPAAFQIDEGFEAVPAPDNADNPVAGPTEEVIIIRGTLELNAAHAVSQLPGYIRSWGDYKIEAPFETDDNGPIVPPITASGTCACGGCDCNGGPDGAHGTLQDVAERLSR